MGWQIELAKLLNKGSKAAKVPKVRFEKLGSLGARFSTWIQGTKLSSWIKAGAAGGIGYTISRMGLRHLDHRGSHRASGGYRRIRPVRVHRSDDRVHRCQAPLP